MHIISTSLFVSQILHSGFFLLCFFSSLYESGRVAGEDAGGHKHTTLDPRLRNKITSIEMLKTVRSLIWSVMTNWALAPSTSQQLKGLIQFEASVEWEKSIEETAKAEREFLGGCWHHPHYYLHHHHYHHHHQCWYSCGIWRASQLK